MLVLPREEPAINAWDYLRSFPYRLWDDQGRGPASNSQLRRWLERGSVRINGVRPKPHDELEFPIWDLVYFPGKKSQTSIIHDCPQPCPHIEEDTRIFRSARETSAGA